MLIHFRFAELPRRQQFIPPVTSTTSLSTRKGTISQFFSTTTCVTCDNQTHQNICARCRSDSQKTVLVITEKILNLERKAATIKAICESCCRRGFDTDCISLDCPVLYTSIRAKRELNQVELYRDILEEF